MTMKRAGMLMAVVALVVLGTSSVRAVDEPVVGHFSIGASLPQGDLKDVLKDGWAFHGGATWFSPKRPNVGLRLDLGVDWFDMKSEFLSGLDTDPSTPSVVTPPDDGYGRAWSGTVDLLWNTNHTGSVGFYLVGGVGVYYTQANLSEVGYGTGYYCDPWWGYCYPGVYEGYYTIASQSSWDWGLNGGAGITFRTSGNTEIYLEAIYHWIDTKKGSEFIPISLGVRW
jgi:hypothetical protein